MGWKEPFPASGVIANRVHGPVRLEMMAGNDIRNTGASRHRTANGREYSAVTRLTAQIERLLAHGVALAERPCKTGTGLPDPCFNHAGRLTDLMAQLIVGEVGDTTMRHGMRTDFHASRESFRKSSHEAMGRMRA